MKKTKYTVKIYEKPFIYEVEAVNKLEAECKAVDKHGGDYDLILKIIVKK